MFVETGIVLLLLLGLIAVNAPWVNAPMRKNRPRTLTVLLAATAATGIIAVPSALWLSHNAAFQQAMTGLFVEISKTLSAVFTPADAVTGSLLSPLL